MAAFRAQVVHVQDSGELTMINGTWQHVLLGLVSVLLSFMLFHHAYEAIVLMMAIEAVQWDVFGIRGREIDTLIDLTADAVGGISGYLIFIQLF